MAEEGSVYELEGFEKQLQSLLKRHSSDELRADGKSFCSDYCKVVEEYTSRWQVPLPQLRILEMALCYFARASSSFTSNCDHECHSALARHQNVHLLQVERLVRAGGAWASSALQAILSESSLPQNEVDGCLSSELPVFFELRVRYLLSCERVSEALALAKCCARHPTVGQHLFFLQVYLTWLYKTSQHDRLHKEADLSGKDAVHIICSLESDETDEVLLGLSRAFIYQQLSRGDMHYLCDLVFVWSKLHSRSNTSKQALLEESHQLMLSATNVSSIFPFIRVILQELGEDGIQFCVELCANALESCLPCDVVTKSLIYKTIAGLLPNDLEVCRACALLVFFMERTVEAYKMMYLHYMHPDQEYHVECSPIRNHIRFETLQVLKKDLYFDPEFWNLIALRTNCLKLMNEKEVGAALEEILEEKWLPNYCTKELASVSSASVGPKEDKGQASRKRQQKEDSADMAPKRLKLDRIKDNAAIGYGQQRRTTRLSEKNRPKRRIKKPKWLLEDSESDNINDISDLTLVTEMVAELTPAELARDLEIHKRQNSADSPSKESVMLLESKGNVPYEIRTTSSCSAPEHGAFVVADWQSQNKEVEMDDSFSELPENSESMEMIPESEESKLEFCCTFCNKVFKGSRVVAHAMFHFRKDECMFCGTMFRDDLLAMMHLSDHIEKLKRSKESAGNIAQQNWVSETKDVSTPKTSAKTKNTNTSPGHRRSRRLRKSSICPKSLSHSASDLSPSQLKKLRSNDKSADDQFLRQKKPNKQFNKVNGHIGIKKMKRGTLQSEAKQLIPQQEVTQDKVKDGAVSPAMSETCDKEEICPGTSVRQLKEVHCSREDNMKETLQVLKTDTKQNKKFSEETKVEPLEQVCCPVDGCTWFTDLSKNRVALLYHALEDHYGDVKPLELSFQIANNKCSICMRVLWSFEHFQHHVERHRLIPRHPCLHQGCTARFKSGMEMRRHARKHSPLQAVCCLPGCSKLFICLWALNLHEREHYASKPTKAAKNTNFQTNNKQDDAQVCKKQSHKSKDASATTAESVKTARKLRGQATHNLSTEKDIAVSSLSTVRESESKQQLKVKSESKDSHVLKNLSNKDTTRKSTGPNLRLRHTLRKVTKTNMSTKTPKFFSLPLLKRNGKLRHKLKRQVKVNTKGHKRRGRPPKPKKAVHDENTTTGGKNCDSLQHKTAQIPTDPPDTAEMQTASKRLEEDSLQVQDVIKITETSNDKPKSKISLSEEIKCDQMEQKGTSHNDSKGNVAAEGLNQLMATTLADKSQKLTTDSVRKILKRRYAPKENGQNAFSHSSKAKKRKIENKVDAKTVKKKRPRKDPEFSTGSKNSDESKVVALKVESSADDEGKTKVENTDSTQVSPSDSKPAGSTNTHNAPTTSGEEKPKKCHSSKEGTTKIASLDSGKKNKHKVNNDRGAKKMSKKSEPRKDRTSTLKKPKSAPQVESKTSSEENVPDSDQKEAKNPISTTPTVTANGIEEVSSSTTTSKNTQEKNSKESPVKKKSNKANEAKKKEDKIKVKKKCQDNSSATKVSQVTAAQAEQVESSSGEDGITLGKILGRPRYSDSCKSVIVDQKPTLCMDTLAEYGKKPHMRVPPTAYLDERFTTMPKRRKEMSYFQSSPKSPPQVQACVPAALQRQRCANCFTTFNSAEELQSHRQLQGCSSLFGFDSDEEGNS
ncbi:uncharacterized protein ACBR49_019704 [Aulostomus maculatus]